MEIHDVMQLHGNSWKCTWFHLSFHGNGDFCAPDPKSYWMPMGISMVLEASFPPNCKEITKMCGTSWIPHIFMEFNAFHGISMRKRYLRARGRKACKWLLFLSILRVDFWGKPRFSSVLWISHTIMNFCKFSNFAFVTDFELFVPKRTPQNHKMHMNNCCFRTLGARRAQNRGFQ